MDWPPCCLSWLRDFSATRLLDRMTYAGDNEVPGLRVHRWMFLMALYEGLPLPHVK